MNKEFPENYLGYEDLVKLLGVSRRTLKNWVDQERLQAIHIGPKSVRFDPADVQKFIENAKSSSPKNPTQ